MCVDYFDSFFSNKACNNTTRSECKLIRSENFPTLFISCFRSICDGCIISLKFSAKYLEISLGFIDANSSTFSLVSFLKINFLFFIFSSIFLATFFCSTFFLLISSFFLLTKSIFALSAVRALPAFRRKFLPYQSLTLTISPIFPSFPIFSSFLNLAVLAVLAFLS